MPTPPVSDETALEAYRAWKEYGNNIEAGKALGVSDVTISRRRREAIARGLHLSEGIRGEIASANLNIGEARGGWKHVYDGEGKKTGTVRWTAPEAAPEDIADKIRTALDGLPRSQPIPAPEHVNADLLTLYPIADAHIGMRAWGQEVGEDYDTDIACRRLRTWVAQCVASSPPSDTAIILDVGDLTHADDQMNATPRSKHVLDVDTRYFKTIDMTIAALATATEAAAAKHKRVIVRILPGNHNPHSYVAIVMALAERYRDDPRITVEKIPGEFFAKQFGKVMIAAHHGDKAKADRLVLFLADQYPDMWGATRHRFLWTGHLHHHKSQDIGGVTWEQLRAVTERDAYATSHAYSARSQLQAITYHREHGEVSRVKTSAWAA